MGYDITVKEMIMSRSDADREAVHNGDMDYFYDLGYDTGYAWLNPDKPYAYNFKHPSVKGGYIPGGPSFGIYVRRGKGWEHDNPQDKAFAGIAYTVWRKGFIDGINQYVKDNGLDYPMVEHSRL
jgi:hypothetical protein